MRIHGTTAARPVEMFNEVETSCLLPVPAAYDVPTFTRVKVHRDFHVEVAKALYSLPQQWIGHYLDARADSDLVKLYSAGQLVKTHPRQRPGGRSTDRADLPVERAGYAMRDLAALIAACAGHGPSIGIYAERLLDDPLPWTRMRSVYRLLGLVRRYGPGPTETACSRSLDLDVVSVSKIASMLAKAVEREQPVLPAAAGSPTGRFARDPAEYASTPGPTHPHPRRRSRHPPICRPRTSPPDDYDVNEHHPSSERSAGPARCRSDPDPACPQARRAQGHPARTARPGPGTKMGHAAFLELLLGDEVTRRESRSAMLRARTAGLDPTMRLDTWDEPDDLSYDRMLLSDLATLRFTEAGHGVLILGPSASARRTWPPRWDTSGSVAVSASTPRAPTSSSPACAPPGSTTASKPRCADSPASTCSSSTTSPSDPRCDRDQRLLRTHRRTPPQSSHHLDLQPGALRMAGHDERHPARPVRHRPAHLRAHTLVIEGPSYRQRDRPTRGPPLTDRESHDAHRHAPGGPMLVATRWSHHTGKRQQWKTHHVTSIRRVGLVGCVKKKASTPQLARDLYASALFDGRRAYVERSCSEWWILSALHGLVHPDQVLEPYDVTLKNAGRAERRDWSHRVLAALDERVALRPGDVVEFHAGSEYRDWGLVDGLLARGVTVETPTEGIPLGRQLAFYAEARRR